MAAVMAGMTPDELPAQAAKHVEPDRAWIASLRHRLRLSQPQFAARYGIALDSLRVWEQGRRRPTGAAHTLLRLIEADHASIEQASRRLGVAESTAP